MANHRQQHFATAPWMMRNWLIYRVYHEVIGQTDGADYCPLVCDFYLIRTLISLWTLDGSPAATGGYFRPLRHV